MLHIPTTWAHCWCAVTECVPLSLLKTRAPCLFTENRNASMGWGKLRLSDVPINTVGILLHSSGNPCKHPSSPPRDFLIDCDYHLFPLRLYPPLGYVIELTGRKICNRVWNWAENVYISWKYLENQDETAEYVTSKQLAPAGWLCVTRQWEPQLINSHSCCPLPLPFSSSPGHLDSSQMESLEVGSRGRLDLVLPLKTLAWMWCEIPVQRICSLKWLCWPLSVTVTKMPKETAWEDKRCNLHHSFRVLLHGRLAPMLWAWDETRHHGNGSSRLRLCSSSWLPPSRFHLWLWGGAWHPEHSSGWVNRIPPGTLLSHLAPAVIHSDWSFLILLRAASSSYEEPGHLKICYPHIEVPSAHRKGLCTQQTDHTHVQSDLGASYINS